MKRVDEWDAWRARLAAPAGATETITVRNHPYSLSSDEVVEAKRRYFDVALYQLWVNSRKRGTNGGAGRWDGGEDRTSSLLLTISRAEIERAAERLGVELNSLQHPKLFTKLFADNAAFFDELLRYLLRPAVYLRRIIRVQQQIWDEILPAARDALKLAADAARVEHADAMEDPLVELGAVVSASLPHYPLARELLTELDNQALASWTAFYQRVVDVKNITLRPGAEPRDLAQLAAIMTEGALVRARALDEGNGSPTAAQMAIGITYVVRGMLAEQTPPESDYRQASQRDLARYLRQIEFDGPVVPDTQTLLRLQEAHLRTFSYSNLDLFGGYVALDDLDTYLSNLLDHGHGGLCYQLNISLAAVLRAIGFPVEFLLGTVSGEANVAGTIVGNHMGLRVQCDDHYWLVDAGMGDGPVHPFALKPHSFTQYGFRYRFSEPGANTWLFSHCGDPRGSFAEIVFQKDPVPVERFFAPAREQATSADFGFLKTTQFMQRRERETWELRGLVLKVASPHSFYRRIFTEGEQDEWFSVIRREFGIYLGNISRSERDRLWERVLAAHPRWTSS